MLVLMASIPEAAIEYSEVILWKGSVLSGLGAPAKAGLKNVMRQAAAQWVQETLKVYGGEMTEEALQGLLDMVTRDAARWLDANAPGTDWKAEWAAYGKEMEMAARSMAWLILPGRLMGGARGAQAQLREAARRKYSTIAAESLVSELITAEGAQELVEGDRALAQEMADLPQLTPALASQILDNPDLGNIEQGDLSRVQGKIREALKEVPQELTPEEAAKEMGVEEEAEFEPGQQVKLPDGRTAIVVGVEGRKVGVKVAEEAAPAVTEEEGRQAALERKAEQMERGLEPGARVQMPDLGEAEVVEIRGQKVKVKPIAVPSEEIRVRKPVKEMEQEEAVKAHLTDMVSGAPNVRAYEESEPSSHEVLIKVPLGTFNKITPKKGQAEHQLADLMLRTATGVMKALGLDFYRLGGPTYLIKAESAEQAQEIAKRVTKALAATKVAGRALTSTKEVRESKQGPLGRKRISEMAPSEVKKALLTDPMTGLGNKRARDERLLEMHLEKPGGQVFSVAADLDGFGDIVRNLGNEQADELMRRIALAIGEMEVFRLYERGDEMEMLVRSVDEGKKFASLLTNRVKSATLKGRDSNGEAYEVTVTGTAEVGRTYREADIAVGKAKQRKARARTRAARARDLRAARPAAERRKGVSPEGRARVQVPARGRGAGRQESLTRAFPGADIERTSYGWSIRFKQAPEPVTVQEVAEIPIDWEAAEAQTGIKYRDDPDLMARTEALGSFEFTLPGGERVGGLALLRLAAGADEATILHERVHVAKAFGLFTEKQWNALVKQYSGIDRAAEQQEEDVATALQRKTITGNTWRQRLRRFFRRILRAFGFESAEDIRRAMDTEKFWQKPARLAAEGAGARFELAPAVESAAFKKWFGDSKVVDADGKPLVVYHGTSTPGFERFSIRGGLGGGLGFWFASTGEAASRFALQRYAGQGPAVMPVYLNISNPTEYQDWEAFTTALRALRIKKGARTLRTIEGSVAALRRSLMRRGYDGVVIRQSDTDMGGLREDWVAFKPQQIKSATANVGTFDPQDPRIRYQLTDALGFYSALQKSVEGMDFRQMPAAQLSARIKKTQGLKQAELDDSGVIGWLADQPGKVRKQDVLDFLQKGGVQIEEVVKGGPGEEGVRDAAIVRTGSIIAVILEAGGLSEADQDAADFALQSWSEKDGRSPQDEASVEEMLVKAGDRRTVQEILSEVIAEEDYAERTTKFQDYTLAGGENYREVLLTVPLPTDKAQQAVHDFVSRMLPGLPNQKKAFFQ